MIKAIFCQCSMAMWVDVAARLAQEIGLRPVYWTGADYMEQPVRERFSDIVFHSNLMAVRGISAPKCKDLKLPPLSQPILEELSFCESNVIHMMGRLDPDYSFTYEERVRQYHSYVKYWMAVLNHFKPEIVIFPIEPHHIYDYVLYELCKKKGITILMFQELPIVPLIYPVEQFESGSEVLKEMYNNLKASKKIQDIVLSPTIEKHLKRLLGDYSDAVSSYTFGQHFNIVKKERKHIPFINTTVFEAKKIAKKPQSFVDELQKGIKEFAKGPKIFDKQKGEKFEDAHWSYWDIILLKARGKKKITRLKRYYEKLTKDADLCKPYVYVALHYQPESSTSPLGGVFVNQFLVVDMLSKCIPNGWNVYVKEHWGQWRPGTYGERARTTDFYDDITSLHNVTMISASIPSFELIDNSKAVATITGTTGWEAIVRGKPTLVFGHAWYRECEGVFYTPSEETCKSALLKIQAGYKVNKEKVKLFLHVLEKVCAKAYLQRGYMATSGISQEENVKALTQTIRSFLQRKGVVKK